MRSSNSPSSINPVREKVVTQVAHEIPKDRPPGMPAMANVNHRVDLNSHDAGRPQHAVSLPTHKEIDSVGPGVGKEDSNSRSHAGDGGSHKHPCQSASWLATAPPRQARAAIS